MLISSCTATAASSINWDEIYKKIKEIPPKAKITARNQSLMAFVVEKLQVLGTYLQSYTGAQTNQKRLAFIGEVITHLVEGNNPLFPINIISQLLAETGNLKNALQMEAFEVGECYPTLLRYKKFEAVDSAVPAAESGALNMDMVLENIEQHFNEGYYEINPVIFIQIAEKCPSLSPLFHQMMVEISSYFKMQGDKIRVYVEDLPPIAILNQYAIRTDHDFASSSLLRMLTAIDQDAHVKLHVNEMSKTSSSTGSFAGDTVSLSPSVTVPKSEKQSTRYLKAHYFEKKNLIPFYHHILVVRSRAEISLNCLVAHLPPDTIHAAFSHSKELCAMASSASHPSPLTLEDTPPPTSEDSLACLEKPSTRLFLSTPILKQMGDENWLEDAALVYEVILKLESICCGIFKDTSLLRETKQNIKQKACDKELLFNIRELNNRPDFRKASLVHPITPDNPFVTSKADFMLIPPYKLYEKLAEMNASKPKKEKIRRAKIKTISPKKQLTKPRREKSSEVTGGDGAMGGAGGPQKLRFSASEEDPLSKPLSVTTTLSTSLEETKVFVHSIKFHERVVIWQRDKESGLEYYKKFNVGASYIGDAEMVLRHRLPEALFLLAFDPLFSKKSTSRIPEIDTIRQEWRSCLIIDGRYFILETTVSHDNYLIHFYAKPVQNWQTYFELTMASPEEFPSLRTETRQLPSNIEGVTFNKTKATIYFEDRIYELLALKDL